MRQGRGSAATRVWRLAGVLPALAALAACGGAHDPGGKANGRTCAKLSDAPVHLPGGSFEMGETDVYPEEGPIRKVTVDGFWIDRHEVTNAQYAAFVAATGYSTVAERPVDPKQFGVPRARIPADMLKPGSAVFTPPKKPSANYLDWWTYVPGASWRKPYGPDGADAVPEEPVVHMAYPDMEAYARWRGGRLPTEAQWEYAARAGGASKREQPTEANTWQGVFPLVNQESDGFKGIAPVGCYQPNRWGLYDMIGNVWEATSDYYAPAHDPDAPERNPTGPGEDASFDPQTPDSPARVIKGGSYLCAPNYCMRYRAAARTGRDPGLGTSNVGFRLVYDHAPGTGEKRG